jgi:hypothetical protein
MDNIQRQATLVSIHGKKTNKKKNKKQKTKTL